MAGSSCVNGWKNGTSGLSLTPSATATACGRTSWGLTRAASPSAWATRWRCTCATIHGLLPAVRRLLSQERCRTPRPHLPNRSPLPRAEQPFVLVTCQLSIGYFAFIELWTFQAPATGHSSVLPFLTYCAKEKDLRAPRKIPIYLEEPI